MSLHQHEVVVAAGLAEGAVEHLHRAFAVALVDFLIGADHALGRFEQAFAVGIVAGIGDQRAHGGFRLLARRPRLDRRRAPPAHARTEPCLGHGFMIVFLASMTVSPFDRHSPKGSTGSVTGVAASVTRRTDFGPMRGVWTPHSHSAWLAPCRRREPLLAPSGQPLYIPLRGRGNPPHLANR